MLFTDDSDEAELKVVDFGFACQKPKDESGLMRTPCFTLQYAAPEVIDQGLPQTSCSANGYNESCDLWSLGVILVRSGSRLFSSRIFYYLWFEVAMNYSFVVHEIGYGHQFLHKLGVLSLVQSFLFPSRFLQYFSLQYTMLSGRSPFLGSHTKSDNSTSNKGNNNDDSVASIIRRIKHGDFRMDHQEAWKYVSSAAKSITKGLLTVEVKKRLNIDSLLASNWINFAANNNNNPPSLLLTPMILNEPAISLVIDRHLKQTFNAYHTVARESSYNSSISGNSSMQSSPASSISSSGAVKSASAASEVVTKTTQDYLSSPFLNTSQVSISPFEAFSGVSYQLMPSFFSGAQVASTASAVTTTTTASGVSITKMGPMTRSRKRKMQDNISSVSITPLASNSASSAASKVEIVTVTKRERTMDYFPQAAPSSEQTGMQYCATARAVVVTPTIAASTWTPTVAAAEAAASASRSVTITID